jgi:hypothetical protein
MTTLLVAFAISLGFGAAGCTQSGTAHTPSVVKPISDVEELAGTWQGWVTDQLGGSSATSAGGTLTRGTFFLESGRLRYRSSRTEGTAEVSEDRGKTLLTQTPEGTVNVATGRAVYERVK